MLVAPPGHAEAGAPNSLAAKLERIAKALRRRLAHDLTREARRPGASAEALQAALETAVDVFGPDNELTNEIEAALERAQRAEGATA